MSNFEALKPKIEQRPCPIYGGKNYEQGFLMLACVRGKPVISPDRTRVRISAGTAVSSFLGVITSYGTYKTGEDPKI